MSIKRTRVLQWGQHFPMWNTKVLFEGGGSCGYFENTCSVTQNKVAYYISLSPRLFFCL